MIVDCAHYREGRRQDAGAIALEEAAARRREEVTAQRDLLTTCLEANMAVISVAQTKICVRQNDSIKQLTIIATVFLPLTVVTGFVGQNFGWLVGRIDTWWAFLAFGIGAPAERAVDTDGTRLQRWRSMEPFTLATTTGAGHVGVLAQSASACAPQLLTIQAWASQNGLEVVDLGTSAEPNGLAAGCQLVIALGGDGTILRALALAMPQHAAVLGVNFGHVGFLADIHGDELAAALETVARGDALLDERTALVATIGGEPTRRVIAFNDVVVARLPGFGLARLRVVVADEALLVLAGDGVVIASPTGSTAYTVGAGGPAVAPSLDAIVITPLASQGTPLRSLVVDGSEIVRVELEAQSAPLSVEIDGRETHAMPAPASLEIRAAARKARLVRTRPRTFYRDLATRL